MHTPGPTAPVRLFIGLPIYAQVPVFFMNCLLGIQRRQPFPILVKVSQGDGVARSRNQLTQDFLETDCTHLLFIDSDLIFDLDHITRIVSHDEPVVGGLYAKKQDGKNEWVLNTLAGEEPDDRGLQKVRYIGTGFLCVRRDVIERMIEQHPETRFIADYGRRRTEHDLWPMGVYEYPDGHRRYLSEDWYFCQRWLDLGGKIFADCGTILRHIGPAVFPLQSQEEDLLGAEFCAAKRSQPDCQPVAPGGRAGLCIGRPASSPVVPQTALANERV